MWWMAARSRANRPLPRKGTFTIIGWVVLASAAIWTYNHQIKRFWEEIGPQWRDHKHALDSDPRNGLAE